MIAETSNRPLGPHTQIAVEFVETNHDDPVWSPENLTAIVDRLNCGYADPGQKHILPSAGKKTTGFFPADASAEGQIPKLTGTRQTVAT